MGWGEGGVVALLLLLYEWGVSSSCCFPRKQKTFLTDPAHKHYVPTNKNMNQRERDRDRETGRDRDTDGQINSLTENKIIFRQRQHDASFFYVRKTKAGSGGILMH